MTPKVSHRKIRRQLINELASQQSIGEWLRGWSQRLFFWGVRVRGAAGTAVVLGFIVLCWLFGIWQVATRECLTLLSTAIGVAIVAGYYSTLAHANAIAVTSIAPQVPFPDKRTWYEFIRKNAAFLMWLIPPMAGCFLLLAHLPPVPLQIKIWLGVSGLLTQFLVCCVIAECVLRIPRWGSGDWMDAVAAGLLMGVLAAVAMAPFNTQFLERVANAVYPVLRCFPFAWPAVAIPGPPAGMNALECAVLLSAVACILAFLQIFLMRRSGRQYRITEVLPYQGYSYVYGFGPYQTKESDIQAYDAWADAVLRDEYPKEAYEDNEFAGETYQDWIANEHFLELERWAGVTAMCPLKFLSPRELGILKVRCVSSEGVYVFKVFENIWKSLVLATLLYVLPPLAVPIAGLSLGWILFGGPIASVFAAGFVRIHGLPYRLEEVLRAESKYRVLTTLSLTLPLLSASVVVGLQLGMTPLQCIDFGVRLLLALTFSSLLFLYAIVFEKGSNTLLRWQGLVLFLVTIPPVALAVGGGVLLIAETGWFAYSGVCAAAIGVKLLYHSALYLYYRGDMDFVLQETAK